MGYDYKFRLCITQLNFQYSVITSVYRILLLRVLEDVHKKYTSLVWVLFLVLD